MASSNKRIGGKKKKKKKKGELHPEIKRPSRERCLGGLHPLTCNLPALLMGEAEGRTKKKSKTTSSPRIKEKEMGENKESSIIRTIKQFHIKRVRGDKVTLKKKKGEEAKPPKKTLGGRDSQHSVFCQWKI